MIWRLLAVVWAFVASAGAIAEERRLRVVVSVAPVHALTAEIMAGAGSPELLIDAAISPHAFALKPSQARRLAQADLIVWVGGSLESPLRQAIATLPTGARVLTLTKMPQLLHLAYRDEEVRDSHMAGPGEAADPHVWLDPANAIAMVQQITPVLQAMDAANAGLYGQNAHALIERISALDDRIRRRLQPVQHVPFVVFHDAYQYLERRYGLTNVGVARLHPEQNIGVRSRQRLLEEIKALGVQCLFAEPQYDASAIKALAGPGGPRLRILDPLGQGLKAGPGLYESLMLRLTDALAGCLTETLDAAPVMP